MKRLAAAWAAVLACAGGAEAAAPPARVDYLRDIKPLLRERCFACHGGLAQKGGLRLDTAALAREGGDTGPAAVPGHAEESLLLDRVATAAGSRRMPPDGPPLSEAQVAALRTWIAQGATGPGSEKPEADPRSHWAFRKVARPPVPTVPHTNPIDRFLAQRWKQDGLLPAAPADRATLARRLHLDLTGLPPTRDELHSFLADASPLAYERLVDRLLASPAYGERWGRHWMDVWRYSDWYGRRVVPDVLNSYGMIWRWRDWIVRSLNEDRPYDRMVQDMLAADELSPTDRDSLPATGFLVRNFFRWNYNQWMRDNVEHTGKAFLGLTFNCCQCHDHKYDPISQKEYFRFRAFFEPLEIRHERMPGEPDPGVYPKYNYSSAYKPITSGMVRVFDEKPDAETWMYDKGDERNRIPGKPPVAPGGPAFLDGDRLAISPVILPDAVVRPGLQAFVQQEETQARLDALKKARAELAKGKSSAAEVAAAEAELASIQARIAADNAPNEKTRFSLARVAARAEKQAALQAALAKLAQQERDLPAVAAAKAEAAKKAIAAQRKAVDAARAAVDKPGGAYTPLGPTYIARSSGRRTALARWITSPDNPLTARVAVNHVWAWHFGRPLVDSTADFGRQAAPPTHPELLDWLASELVAGEWRFKRLHRVIVTSEAYRMASTHPDDAGNRKHDPDNRLLWRYPARRLEAESVRDGLLHAAGELDRSMGGHELAQDQGLAVQRRSLYFSHHGEARMEFLDLFDAGNACDCYKRAASVRPQQALALANSELVTGMARRLAAKLSPAVPSPDAFIAAAFEQVLSRPPTAAERTASAAFLDRQEKLFRASGLPLLRARENLVQALFNHTDFVTLR